MLALIHLTHVVVAAAAPTGSSIPGLSGITKLTGDLKLAGLSLSGLAIMAGAGTYAFSAHAGGQYATGRGHTILVRAIIGALVMGIATLLPAFLVGIG